MSRSASKTDFPVRAETMLLRALTRGEGFSADLIERVKELSNGQLVIPDGSIHPELRSLEDQGFVTHSDKPGPGGGRPRRIYAITAQGRRALDEDRARVGFALGLAPALEGA